MFFALIFRLVLKLGRSGSIDIHKFIGHEKRLSEGLPTIWLGGELAEELASEHAFRIAWRTAIDQAIEPFDSGVGIVLTAISRRGAIYHRAASITNGWFMRKSAWGATVV